MEITKQRAQSLRMKMRHAELNLKGATVIYGCSKIAAHTGSTPSTGRENIRASFQLITRRVSVVNIEVHFAAMTGERSLLHTM